jgi:hypothetical protein
MKHQLLQLVIEVDKGEMDLFFHNTYKSFLKWQIHIINLYRMNFGHSSGPAWLVTRLKRFECQVSLFSKIVRTANDKTYLFKTELEFDQLIANHCFITHYIWWKLWNFLNSMFNMLRPLKSSSRSSQSVTEKSPKKSNDAWTHTYLTWAHSSTNSAF